MFCMFFEILLFLSHSFAEDTKIFVGEWVANCSDSNNNQKTCILQRSMYIDKDLRKISYNGDTN